MRTEMILTIRDLRDAAMDAADALDSKGDAFMAARLRKRAEPVRHVIEGRFPCCAENAAREQIAALLSAAHGLESALPGIGAPEATFAPSLFGDETGEDA